MSANKDGAELLAGPLVERWKSFHGAEDDVHGLKYGQRLKCADELLAHLRESGLVERMRNEALVEKAAQKVERLIEKWEYMDEQDAKDCAADIRALAKAASDEPSPDKQFAEWWKSQPSAESEKSYSHIRQAFYTGFFAAKPALLSEEQVRKCAEAIVRRLYHQNYDQSMLEPTDVAVAEEEINALLAPPAESAKGGKE